MGTDARRQVIGAVLEQGEFLLELFHQRVGLVRHLGDVIEKGIKRRGLA